MEQTPGVALGMHNEFWAATWVTNRFRKLGVAQSQIGGRSHGCIGRESSGCEWCGTGETPPGSHSALLGAQDFLGQAFVALGEVIGSQRGRLERPLT